MAMRDNPTLTDVASAKGGIPLKNREHALRVIRQAIVRLRKDGVSQGDIGRRFGLSQSMISDLEGGRISKLGVKTLFYARDELQMTIDDILGMPKLKKKKDDLDPPESGEVSA